MADNEKEKSESELKPGNIEKLLERIGGENGILGPLVKQLKELLKDPVLKQTLEAAPSDASSNIKKH